MAQSGQPNNPIMLMNYPGNTPVIAPPCAGSGYTVSLVGSWLVLSGFEITTGWDGVDVYGANNLVTNNNIHDTCGQGILVASAHDVAITQNRISGNGVKNSGNSRFHGIYFSDYYQKGMYNLSVLNNTISNHAGGGLQSWDSTQRKRNLLVQNNTFSNNAFEVIFTNTDSSTVIGNTFTHNSYPATTFSQAGIFWLELDSNISFSNNLIHYGVPQTASGPTNYLIFNDQPSVGISYSGNTWQLPPGFPTLTDAIVNYALTH